MNLGGDALLVAPCPMAPETDLEKYSSLASFMRQAPQDQTEAFWLESAKATLDYIETKKPSQKKPRARYLDKDNDRGTRAKEDAGHR